LGAIDPSALRGTAPGATTVIVHGRPPAAAARLPGTNASAANAEDRAWPKLRVEIVADDLAHDLLAQNIDVAVRQGAPKSSTFVARKLATLDEPIVAAPALAEALGPVTRPRELAAAPWVRPACSRC
jgi:DNA-binding transcriptional LysR family regulator